MKHVTYFVILTLFALLTGAVYSQTEKENVPAMKERPAKFKERGPEGRMNQKRVCSEMMFKELGLDDKQIDKLVNIKKDEMKETHKNRQKMQEYRHLLHMALMEEELDEKEIYSLAEQIGKMEQEAIKLKVEHLKKLKELLTKEQFKKLSAQRLMMVPEGKGQRGEDGPRGKMGKGMPMDRE